MRKTIQFLQLAFLFLLATACAETSPFKYESVPNDPLKARIYTLDNGLKVYMTVNKETHVFKRILPFAWEVKTILPKRPGWHTILNT